MTRCHSCTVAGYLEEEATAARWYGQDSIDGILALARSWHRKCDGCECCCEKKESPWKAGAIRRFLMRFTCG